ncbi:UNVERIFIED_CONTAM: hypothetical protein K2H54_009218 [Gekko kuhli]
MAFCWRNRVCRDWGKGGKRSVHVPFLAKVHLLCSDRRPEPIWPVVPTPQQPVRGRGSRWLCLSQRENLLLFYRTHGGEGRGVRFGYTKGDGWVFASEKSLFRLPRCWL